MKTQLLAVAVFVAWILPVSTLAQGDEEFKKWKNEEDSKFQQFKDKNDRAFYEFLKHEWRGVDMFRGAARDPVPDPVRLPVYKPPTDLPKPTLPPSPTVSVKPPKDIEPTKPIVPPPSPPPDAASIDFYGADLSVSLPSSLGIRLKGEPGKESISDYFATMAGLPYDRSLSAAKITRAERRLNDWGYCLLLASMGEKLYGHGANERVLFTWFMLLKSGYEAKVGFTGNRIQLLLPVDGRLFAIPYFSFGNDQRYYAVPLDPHSSADVTHLFAYEGTYPGTTMLMRFTVPELPSLSNTTATRTLQFAYNDTTYSVPVTYSQDAVRFFEYYPQSDFPVYFDGSISPGA